MVECDTCGSLIHFYSIHGNRCLVCHKHICGGRHCLTEVVSTPDGEGTCCLGECWDQYKRDKLKDKIILKCPMCGDMFDSDTSDCRASLCDDCYFDYYDCCEW